jgi:hypothetical protein
MHEVWKKIFFFSFFQEARGAQLRKACSSRASPPKCMSAVKHSGHVFAAAADQLSEEVSCIKHSQHCAQPPTVQLLKTCSGPYRQLQPNNQLQQQPK